MDEDQRLRAEDTVQIGGRGLVDREELQRQVGDGHPHEPEQGPCPEKSPWIEADHATVRAGTMALPDAERARPTGGKEAVDATALPRRTV